MSRESLAHLSPRDTQLLMFDLPGEGLEHMRAIIGMAQRQGIQVRLVISPLLNTFKMQLPHYDLFVKTLAEKTGLKIWDYSGSLNDLECFADGVHINLKGSIKFMSMLARDGFFPAGTAGFH